MDVLDAMERTYRNTATVVAGLRAEQAGAPTPCPQFDVTMLFGHLIGVLDMFTAGLRDEPYVPKTDLSLVDALDTYTTSADANLAAWRSLPDFDTSITLPFGTMPAATSVHLNVIDVQVHGWDLATATGQPATIPDDLAEESLAFVTQMLRPEMRSDAPDASFGPEITVPTDAPVTDRLVAFLGRHP